MEKKKIIMYTDGGSRNNPGPAAIGVYFESLHKQFGHYIGEKTNNEAEYEAVIFGLKKIKHLLSRERAREIEVVCFLDSEFAAKQLNHEYKVKEKNIQNLFLEVWNLTIDFKSVEFHHIPREKNKIADKLVNQALDQEAKQTKLI